MFGFDVAVRVALYRYLFPGYTLVAYDDRGTGDSGLLDCPPLQSAIAADTERIAAAACAASIGAPRDFYSTADHAEDLDAVRQSLGFDKIALYGVSYGTKLAMAYALAHPDHVERLLLDSVLPPELPDPLQRERRTDDAGDARRVLLGRRLPLRDSRLRRRRDEGREPPRGERRSRFRSPRPNGQEDR